MTCGPSRSPPPGPQPPGGAPAAKPGSRPPPPPARSWPFNGHNLNSLHFPVVWGPYSPGQGGNWQQGGCPQAICKGGGPWECCREGWHQDAGANSCPGSLPSPSPCRSTAPPPAVTLSRGGFAPGGHWAVSGNAFVTTGACPPTTQGQLAPEWQSQGWDPDHWFLIFVFGVRDTLENRMKASNPLP